MEYYDITDPFIDDDELVLQERTAASKDGFFVFQGPLVAEGEKVRIEKIDGGPSSKRGKGSRAAKASKPKTVPVVTVRTPRAKATTGSKDDEAQSFITPGPKQASKVTSSAAHSPESSETESEEGNTSQVASPAATRVADNDPNNAKNEDKKLPVVTKAQLSTNSDRKSASDLEKSATKANGQKPASAVPSAVSASTIDPRKRAVSVTAATELRDLVKPPSAAALAKRAERARKKAAAMALAAATTPNSLPPGSPQTPGSPSVGDASQAPIFNSDGTIRKPRRPAREKTAEEKAELARKARETRERKKAEKRAQMEAEQAALLARAIANPLVDTTGLSLSSVSPAAAAMRPSVSPSPAALTNILSTPAAAPAASQEDVSMEMRAVKEESVKQAAPLSATAHQDHLRTTLSAAEVERTESPSGRSMKLDAFLE